MNVCEYALPKGRCKNTPTHLVTEASLAIKMACEEHALIALRGGAVGVRVILDHERPRYVG